jgi:lauroyl/myristoyl acyltransferase
MLRVVPVPIVRTLAADDGTVAWALQGERRRTLLENLSYIAPDRPGDHGRLARRTFLHLALAAVEQFRFPSISREELI